MPTVCVCVCVCVCVLCVRVHIDCNVRDNGQGLVGTFVPLRCIYVHEAPFRGLRFDPLRCIYVYEARFEA